MKYIKNSFLFFIGGLLTFCLLYLALHAHPSFDDLAWPVWVREMGAIETQSFVYTNLNGRILATLVSTLTMAEPLFFEKYKAILFIYILAFLIAIYRFSYITLGIQKGKKEIALSVTAVLTFSYLIIILESSSLFFWLTGTIVYLSTLILFILLLAEIALLYNKTTKQKFNFQFGFMAMLCFTMPLFSEMGVFITMPLLFYLILVDKIKNKFYNYHFIILLFFLSLGMFINYIGSLNRINQLHEVTHNKDIFLSFKIVLTSLKLYITTPNIFGLFIINIAFFLFLYSCNIKKEHIFSIRSPYILLGIGVVTLIFGLFASAFVLGVAPPKRVWNVLLISLQIFCFLAMVVFNNRFQKPRFKQISAGAFVGLITLSIALPTTFRQMLGDVVKGKAKKYDYFMQDRYKNTELAISDTLYLEELKENEIPISIMFNTGAGFAKSTESDYWYYNEYYSKYFGIKAVYPAKK